MGVDGGKGEAFWTAVSVSVSESRTRACGIVLEWVGTLVSRIYPGEPEGFHGYCAITRVDI
jgi:hypothetical protein